MKMGAFVLGYHGCDKEVGEDLLAGKTEFKPSSNQYDWLGHGIYFWENNPQRALDWAAFMARSKSSKSRVKTPFAVGAVIELGNCLDLTEAASLALVEESYSSLQDFLQSQNIPMPQNKAATSSDEDLVRRNLDCAVINNVHLLRDSAGLIPFDTVRGAFHEGAPLYPGSGIRKKTHIQIAVRSNSSIIGIFRIRSF